MQHHLSAEGEIAVVATYQAGKTINAVAREFKLHRTTVTAILDRHGVPVRAHHMTENLVNEARALYESGLSLAGVGARLGFDAATIASRWDFYSRNVRAVASVRTRSPRRPPGSRSP